MPTMAMDLEFVERGPYNGNGPGIFGARCLECQWTWNLWSAVPRMAEWQWTWNFWSAVPRMSIDLEFWSAVPRMAMDLASLERGA